MEARKPEFVTNLRCLVCGKIVQYGNVFTCPNCGVEGILDVQYDYDSIPNLQSELHNRQLNHWRYRELLPLSADIPFPHLHVGWTPVYDVPRLAQAIGIIKIIFKR